MNNKAIAVVSGGIDSVTMAYLLKSRGFELHLVSFDYGQRHSKELEFASRCVGRLDAAHTIVDLSGVGAMLKGSALTDDVPVPLGHYTDEVMKLTIVPNRNAIMLAVAYGIAVAEGIETVGIGVHAGDHPIYPDCRPEFVAAFDLMEKIATGTSTMNLFAPFVHKTKAEIVEIGAGLGVPYEDTWSCYQGGDLHCGKCGTCVERKEAFELAGVYDPTEYAE
jgi:7-cyano-7-deazaguanine synthase